MFLSSNRVVSVCFSSDGKQIASGSWDNTVKIWNASSGELQSTLTGHTGYVPAFPCSACIQVVVFAHYPVTSRSVYCVGFDPSGKKLVSGSGDQTVKVWSIGSSGTFECESTLRGDKAVHCVSFSPDGDMLAAGDGDYQGGNVRLYDVQTGEVKSTLAGHRYVPSPCIECLLL